MLTLGSKLRYEEIKADIQANTPDNFVRYVFFLPGDGATSAGIAKVVLVDSITQLDFQKAAYKCLMIIS